MKIALVLSGGGLFGAWQAGAWRALAKFMHPDLIVGASVGSLNGWAIAGGATPDELIGFWMNQEVGVLRNLPKTIQSLMEKFPLKTSYAVVLTDSLRMKPVIFSNEAVTWRHLAASCAIPLVLPQYKIDGRWYSDGGLLNPLPVWAAIDLGATDIVAIHPIWPSAAILFRPLVRGFVRVFGHHPQVPTGVNVATLGTPALGSMRDALRWNREKIARWIDDGERAGTEFCKKHFGS
jgi:predicted acylesterase/phospholipase RssA